MKVLVVGGGGREHALVWKLAQSPSVTQVFAAPGNPGMACLAQLVPLPVDDLPGLVQFATRQAIDLTVIGPEEPLAAGLADQLLKAHLRVFGPTAAAARIESDKAFAKDLCRQFHIPTAEGRAVSTLDEATAYIRSRREPPVIKAAGLARGKGVVVPVTHAQAERVAREMLVENSLGPAGHKLVIEERLTGSEISLLALTDGTTIYVLEACQDHKRLGDGDTGPNTGGMGAFCPTPLLTPALLETIQREILVPAVHGLKATGSPMSGVLYAGLMLTNHGPRLLEFNARFGDPECQTLMMRFRGDLAQTLALAADGKLHRADIAWDPRPAVAVVMASEGYPDAPQLGRPIQGLGRLATGPDLMVFHAGTRTGSDGWIETAGGRVLTITALGETFAVARQRVYSMMETITFEGAVWRTDIAHAVAPV